ncbi:hypothetical protein HUW51_11795 [Adhaeribacter swui]|uniref:YdeI/OmpD-associated family protein n=1 Tax=Adhaeribacter swui TaxID=2086471 RepID=A0A7G7G886_9BACT|nr:hypothetical protein [Adhaeribacter swui]QNF33370.1 hypothetical protein HUW51_11795 [Adhaeribacter swui]
METNKGVATFYAPTRQQWRAWLAQNYQTAKEIYLIIYHIKSPTPCLTYSEAVEEALCYGWIDSVKNKRDPESAYQRFSPRKPKSTWSKLNRERVEKLVNAGLMTEAGQKMVDLAKQTGTWEPVAVPLSQNS